MTSHDETVQPTSNSWFTLAIFVIYILVDKEKERPSPLIKEERYPLFGSSPWLSPQHNFIQQSLDSDSAQVQILFAACRRFAMVRISDNGPGWK